jgi:hypothetical protein
MEVEGLRKARIHSGIRVLDHIQLLVIAVRLQTLGIRFGHLHQIARVFEAQDLSGLSSASGAMPLSILMMRR